LHNSVHERRRRATIEDVARAAGVSATTVSHSITGNRPVAPSTRDRIETAMRELGFRPNHVARTLRTQRSHTIALVCPDITNPFYPALARGLEDVVGEHGYTVIIGNTDNDARREYALLADTMARQVDAVMLATFELNDASIRAEVPPGVPIVWLGSGTTRDDIDSVCIDEEHGGFVATRLLLELGHRRIAMVGGSSRTTTGRLGGYRLALREAALPFAPELVVEADWTRTGGRDAVHPLLTSDTRPTGVFCANDLMAIGAIDAARECGLRVPEDLSVVGFDDISIAGLLTPALTTVANPAYESGRAGGELLLERLGDARRAERRQITLTCELVERQSAAPPALTSQEIH
jgi:LacI family transcriptional regulator